MTKLKGLAESGKAVAVVTHDPRLQIYADRAVEVKNGFVTDFVIQKDASK
jgi:putative ABC transport system ATP-binding protein